MSRRALRSVKSGQIEEPMINLTPLIDVVFVILIMFILIAPMLELDQVELAHGGENPNLAGVSTQDTGPISIHVHKDNSISFNGKPVTLAQLPARLKEMKRQHPKARPQVFHDKRAHFGTYQAIKNAAETAGFRQLDIVLKPG